jgi:hypothetical protein
MDAPNKFTPVFRINLFGAHTCSRSPDISDHTCSVLLDDPRRVNSRPIFCKRDAPDASSTNVVRESLPVIVEQLNVLELAGLGAQGCGDAFIGVVIFFTIP